VTRAHCLALALLTAAFLAPGPATAQSWTGAANGNWSNGANWSPTGVPASGQNTQLTFGATPNAVMTDDIGGTFILNQMTFNAGDPAYSLTGGALAFQSSTTPTLPTIVVNSTNGVTIGDAVTLTNNLTVSGAGNMTLNGVVGGTGSLTMSGTGIMILGNAGNSYGGGTNIPSGTVQVAVDGALGTGPVSLGSLGTLTYSGTTSTARTITSVGGILSVAAGQTLTMNGATVGGGFMVGPGTFTVTGSTVLAGVMTQTSAVINETGPDSFINFTNNGPLTVSPAVTSTLKGFTNQGSGAITVGGAAKVNAADFQSYGMLTLNPAAAGSGLFTEFVNSGTSMLFFNGGSQTFIGTPATAPGPQGPYVDGIDLHGQNAVVAEALFVNNGFVVDSGAAGTATIIADFGSVVKGAGLFQNTVITQNGGKFQAGNSPGSVGFGSFVFGPGGVNNYVFAIDDAGGTAGPSPDSAGHVRGWGLIRANRMTFGSTVTPGNFSWTATPANKLTVSLDTLDNPTTVGTDVPGMMAGFDPTRAYSWLAAQWSGTYSGPIDPAVLDASTSFDTSGFLNPVAGTFGWSIDPANDSLSLIYTPSPGPEPGTLTLVGLAAVGLAWRQKTNRTASIA
jgi:autotransporter-associated beta strand protein